MSIDFEKNINLKIKGELGKYNSLPIDDLVKIAESLQNLIFSIARQDVSTEDDIHLNNFKIELISFKGGSAMPSFAFTKRVEPTFTSFDKQRKAVTHKLNEIFVITDKGDYQKLKEMYPEPLRRNDIVENLYSFSSSFKNSPVSVYDEVDSHISYRIIKFKEQAKKSLLTKIVEPEIESEEKQCFASITIKKTKTGKKRNKIKEVYTEQNIILTYSFDSINFTNTIYSLNYPLLCNVEKEEDGFVIEYTPLNIVGAGETIEDASYSFVEEFDYTYNKLNSLDDKKLSKRLLRVKNLINDCVKNIS